MANTYIHLLKHEPMFFVMLINIMISRINFSLNISLTSENQGLTCTYARSKEQWQLQLAIILNNVIKIYLS